jgi:hypothetical protein
MPLAVVTRGTTAAPGLASDARGVGSETRNGQLTAKGGGVQ